MKLLKYIKTKPFTFGIYLLLAWMLSGIIGLIFDMTRINFAICPNTYLGGCQTLSSVLPFTLLYGGLLASHIAGQISLIILLLLGYLYIRQK